MTDLERHELDVRPTRDEMRARHQDQDEAAGGRGRLRVYLGLAPGVGKTFRMLEEGRRRLSRGTDVVVGYVEPHGRPGTRELLEGLETLPRRRFEYLGLTVEEMDPQAVIERRPTVALIDELAHANVPGSLRDKRWQDVEAIRDAGIHVVSTLNVQHLVSVADAAATIIGAPVNERLPDAILFDADEIELVDMSPQALRQRMKDGHVYPPERAEAALQGFFSEGNLTALREIALRVMAQRVEGQLEGGLLGSGLPQVTERVLVFIDGSAAADRAVRHAAALAGALHAAFVALVVETAGSADHPVERTRRLREATGDAADLGADVVTVEAPDLVSGLEGVARGRRATHAVLPYTPQRGLGRRFQRPLGERLLERLPGLEVHLVGAPGDDSPARHRPGEGPS